MKKTILYVDDEKINLMLLELNFKDKYNVITSLSGADGLKKLEENPEISLVISDMKMPEMNGIEFAEKVKSAYPHVAFFILTGYEILPEIEDALNSGLILECFSKPLNIPKMTKTINDVVGQPNFQNK